MAQTQPIGTRAPSIDELTRLANDALGDAQELFRAEVALAKDELRAELKKMAIAAAAFSVAVLLLDAALLFLGLAVVFALGAGVAAVIGVAIGFLVLAGALALAGRALLKKPHMDRTRARLLRDARTLAHAHEGPN